VNAADAARGPNREASRPPQTESVTVRYDLAHIRRTLALLEPGAVHELRALNVRDGRWKCTVSGYYDDRERMARDAASISGRADGVYFGLNPAIRDVICRAKNRLQWRPKHTTSDAEVKCRRLLLVDCDPERPAGISATDEERALALDRTRVIRSFLVGMGFPNIVFAASGNGGHLLVPFDRPNDEENRDRAEAFLQGLAEQFDDERVKVDRACFNAARLCRLYGTLACKGDDCPEEGRPWRISKMLEVR
jgi:hypothetical protein